MTCKIWIELVPKSTEHKPVFRAKVMFQIGAKTGLFKSVVGPVDKQQQQQHQQQHLQQQQQQQQQQEQQHLSLPHRFDIQEFSKGFSRVCS